MDPACTCTSNPDSCVRKHHERGVVPIMVTVEAETSTERCCESCPSPDGLGAAHLTVHRWMESETMSRGDWSACTQQLGRLPRRIESGCSASRWLRGWSDDGRLGPAFALLEAAALRVGAIEEGRVRWTGAMGGSPSRSRRCGGRQAEDMELAEAVQDEYPEEGTE